jgi:glycosyltransferase involved in cell wall biosynthesis
MAEGSRRALTSRGISEDKIHYIPNGADPEDFVPSAPRDELRSKYGFDRFTAIYTGAHGPANGLGLLLDAASKVADLDLDIVLVGGGVDKPALMARAEREGLEHVHFLDPVPKSEIPDLLAAADLGLHVLADVPLFHSAVSPNKVFDYMAAGLPVLTNCHGVVADVVHRAACGMGVRPRDLASGLREFHSSSRSALRRQGGAGRTWIGDHQSRGTGAARLAAVLLGREYPS